MKLLVCLSFMVLVSLTEAGTELHPRGCIYVLGKCHKECEEGTRAYSVGCGKIIREATCENPNPVEEEGIICDYSSCYCDPPTVRHKYSNKCVKLEDCAYLDGQEKSGKEEPKEGVL